MAFALSSHQRAGEPSVNDVLTYGGGGSPSYGGAWTSAELADVDRDWRLS